MTRYINKKYDLLVCSKREVIQQIFINLFYYRRLALKWEKFDREIVIY